MLYVLKSQYYKYKSSQRFFNFLQICLKTNISNLGKMNATNSYFAHGRCALRILSTNFAKQNLCGEKRVRYRSAWNRKKKEKNPSLKKKIEEKRRTDRQAAPTPRIPTASGGPWTQLQRALQRRGRSIQNRSARPRPHDMSKQNRRDVTSLTSNGEVAAIRAVLFLFDLLASSRMIWRSLPFASSLCRLGGIQSVLPARCRNYLHDVTFTVKLKAVRVKNAVQCIQIAYFVHFT